jgi:hypothetical protein
MVGGRPRFGGSDVSSRDWKVTGVVDRPSLMNLIARLEAYHREGRIEVIVSARDAEEAREEGLRHMTLFCGVPGNVIRYAKARRMK